MAEDPTSVKRTHKQINIFDTIEMVQPPPPTYKLTSFTDRALVEPIRFLFNYGGIEYEDCRLAQEDWPKIKSSMPFGQLPVLEHNGRIVNQNIAIARYVAKIVKLVGNDDWEDLEIDAIVDTINDLCLKIAEYYYETDSYKKDQQKGAVFNEIIPYYLRRLDAVIQKNHGYLAVGRLTWADLYLAGISTDLNQMTDTDLFENYPNLKQLIRKVLELSTTKPLIENLPKSAT